LANIFSQSWFSLDSRDRLRIPNLDLSWNGRTIPVQKLSPGIRSSHTQDGAIVLDTLHGQMFSLNPVGSRIIELLKAGRNESQVVDEISRDCGASREVVETDLREFLALLEMHQLLEMHASSAPL
jgi:hypothetical protein